MGDQRRPARSRQVPTNDTNIRVNLCVGQTPGRPPERIFTVCATTSVAKKQSVERPRRAPPPHRQTNTEDQATMLGAEVSRQARPHRADGQASWAPAITEQALQQRDRATAFAPPADGRSGRCSPVVA